MKGSGRMMRATMGIMRRNVWLNDWSLFDERVLLASTMVQLSTMAKTVKPMPARPAAGVREKPAWATSRASTKPRQAMAGMTLAANLPRAMSSSLK